MYLLTWYNTKYISPMMNSCQKCSTSSLVQSLDLISSFWEIQRAGKQTEDTMKRQSDKSKGKTFYKKKATQYPDKRTVLD